MNTKKIISLIAGLALVASLALAVPAFAQSQNSQSDNGDHAQVPISTGQSRTNWMMNRSGGVGNGPGMMRPGVSGKVISVSGNLITISGHQGFGSTTPAVTYTIDASKATIKKNNVAGTISSIAVGDMIFVQGTVSGTNVTATTILDGAIGRMMGNRGTGDEKNGTKPGMMGSSTQQVIGNGQPVVAGTVSAVNGNALTVTTSSNVVYTIDASNAKVLVDQNTIALSSVIVGSKVIVQGTVNGNSVVASTIVDQSSAANGASGSNKSQSHGFFSSIGQFFMHMFGF